MEPARKRTRKRYQRTDEYRKFRLYHAAHPEVYDELVRLARRTDRRPLAIAMLFELVRWHFFFERGSQGTFKISNNYKPYYARMIMDKEPDLTDAFIIHRLQNE